jgi:anti-sigma factor RsiW
VGVERAGRSHDGICDEILATYSDYLDGLLAPHVAAQVQWHLASCSSCARYDRVVRAGADLLRELPDVAPSADFTEWLQHRLYHVQDGPAIAESRAGAGAAATFAVASAIALLAWSPLFFGSDVGFVETAAVATMPAPASSPARLLLDDTGDRWPGGARLVPLAEPARVSLGGGDAIQVLRAFPGPHSPLVVQPPVHRAVRTVSSEYTPFQ